MNASGALPVTFEKLLPGCSHGKTLKSLEVAEFIITENVHRAGSKISEHAHENAHFCFVLQGSYSEFDGRRGAIKVGLRADIIATQESPLDNIQTLKKVAFVMKNGKVFKKAG